MSADQTAPVLNPVPPVLVIPPKDHEQDEKDTPGKPDSLPQLVFGFIFGIVFGFLLQKGGVAKYEVLMGQFFLTDFCAVRNL